MHSVGSNLANNLQSLNSRLCRTIFSFELNWHVHLCIFHPFRLGLELIQYFLSNPIPTRLCHMWYTVRVIKLSLPSWNRVDNKRTLFFCSVSISKNYYPIILNHVLHGQKKEFIGHKVWFIQYLADLKGDPPKIIGSVALGTSRKQVLNFFCILNFFIQEGTYIPRKSFILFTWIPLFIWIDLEVNFNCKVIYNFTVK